MYSIGLTAWQTKTILTIILLEGNEKYCNNFKKENIINSVIFIYIFSLDFFLKIFLTFRHHILQLFHTFRFLSFFSLNTDKDEDNIKNKIS